MTKRQSPGFVNAIGNTPLIRLHGVSEMSGCAIFGKAEFMTPGGSVKDRAALYIVKDAEERGYKRIDVEQLIHLDPFE